MMYGNRHFTRQVTSEQEITVSRERGERIREHFNQPNTYLGKSFGGFASVPLYKIARQARNDAFKDIEEKGFAFAYNSALPHFRDQWSDKFDLYQMTTYIQNYQQVVEGWFMGVMP